MEVCAGKLEKGDVRIVIKDLEEGAKEGAKKEIDVKSDVFELYGDWIRKEVESLSEGLNNVRIEVEDKGALPWVLEARMESARRVYAEEK